MKKDNKCEYDLKASHTYGAVAMEFSLMRSHLLKCELSRTKGTSNSSYILFGSKWKESKLKFCCHNTIYLGDYDSKITQFNCFTLLIYSISFYL